MPTTEHEIEKILQCFKAALSLSPPLSFKVTHKNAATFNVQILKQMPVVVGVVHVANMRMHTWPFSLACSRSSSRNIMLIFMPRFLVLLHHESAICRSSQCSHTETVAFAFYETYQIAMQWSATLTLGVWLATAARCVRYSCSYRGQAIQTITEKPLLCPFAMFSVIGFRSEVFENSLFRIGFISHHGKSTCVLYGERERVGVQCAMVII